MDETYFFFGEWQITPSANSLRRGDIVKQLEPKAMDVLQLLCRHDGEVLSSDEIVNQCWPTSEVGDNPLHKIINQLRRAFGDNATNPSYIETIRKRGYRTLAKVTFPIGTEQAVSEQSWHAGSPFPGPGDRPCAGQGAGSGRGGDCPQRARCGQAGTGSGHPDRHGGDSDDAADRNRTGPCARTGTLDVTCQRLDIDLALGHLDGECGSAFDVTVFNAGGLFAINHVNRDRGTYSGGTGTAATQCSRANQRVTATGQIKCPGQ